MVTVLWTILAGMGVFDRINGTIGQDAQEDQQRFDIMDYIGLGRVVSLSIVIAVIDVILIAAITTLGAFLYNVSSALVGGVQPHADGRLTRAPLAARRPFRSRCRGEVTSCPAPPSVGGAPIAVHGPIAQTVRALP